MTKDSLDITVADRELLARAVDDSDTSAVLITHGTDTVTDTAHYLALHATSTAQKVVVLTGSLQPAAMSVSDAALNVGAAVMACQLFEPGVYVCMNGRVFRAGTVHKDPATGRFVPYTALVADLH